MGDTGLPAAQIQNQDADHDSGPIYQVQIDTNATQRASTSMRSIGDGELFYKLSKRRWAILAGISIFGFLNGFVNELTAILGTMVSLVGLPLDRYVYISQAFGTIAPLFALPTAYLVDRHGLRAAALAALLLTAVRNLSRALLFWPQSPHWSYLKFLHWTLTSCSSAQVASIYWCLPLKVSEGWFPERERSLAWSCMVAGPLLGMALSSLWTPWVVAATGESTNPLAYANLSALAITMVALGLGVTRSRPNQAPSARQQAKPAALERRPLGESIKSLMGNKDVLIIVLTLASFESGETSIRGLMQDILAATGFSQTFCGQYLATISIFSAILQLFSASMAPDRPSKTGKSGRCKLYVGIQWSVFAFYALTLMLKQLHLRYWWLIILSSLLYTVCKVWASPTYNNQVAHLISGSMSEATVGAANTIACYLLTNAYTVIFVYFRQVEPDKHHKHHHHQESSDYFNSILLILALVSSSSFLYLVLFGGRSINVGGQVQPQESSSQSDNVANVVTTEDSLTPPGFATPKN